MFELWKILKEKRK